MSKLIAVRLEPDHQTPEAFSFYAYFQDGGFDFEQVNQVIEADGDDDRLEGGAYGLSEELSVDAEEVPNAITRATGLRRFFVCQGC